MSGDGSPSSSTTRCARRRGSTSASREATRSSRASSTPTPRAAIEAGFRRALRTIVDTHLTVMGTAVILLSFGTSSVKGFGVSLFIGLGASLFTAYFFTRLLFDLLYMGRRKVETISI